MSRRHWALLAGAPVAAGLLFALPAPAYAAATISPANGTVYTSNTTVNISAKPDSNCAGELDLQYPDGTKKQLRTFSANQSPSYGLATSGQPDGVYTIVLQEKSALFCSGHTYSSKFTLQIPGAAPQNLQATSLGSGQIQLTWDANTEPGTVGYAILNPDNNYQPYDIGKPYLTNSDAKCGSSCTTVLQFDPNTAATYDFAVASERSCPGCGSDPVASPPSDAASASVAPPGSPSPSPTTSGSGSTSPSGGSTNSSGGTSGGSTPTAGTTGSSRAGGVTFRSGGSSTGSAAGAGASVPKGPAVVFQVGGAAAGPVGVALPGNSTDVQNGPTPWGTYNPTLPYPTTTTVAEPSVAPERGTLHKVAAAFDNPLSPRHVARSAAAALVLLVLAAHIWAWAFAPSRD